MHRQPSRGETITSRSTTRTGPRTMGATRGRVQVRSPGRLPASRSTCPRAPRTLGQDARRPRRAVHDPQQLGRHRARRGRRLPRVRRAARGDRRQSRHPRRWVAAADSPSAFPALVANHSVSKSVSCFASNPNTGIDLSMCDLQMVGGLDDEGEPRSVGSTSMDTSTPLALSAASVSPTGLSTRRRRRAARP